MNKQLWCTAGRLLAALTCATAAATAQSAPPAASGGIQAFRASLALRIAAERVAKLHFETLAQLDVQRSEREKARELRRLEQAVETLSVSLLDARRKRLAAGLFDSMPPYLEHFSRPAQPASVALIYGDSEALASKISFLSVAVSGDLSDQDLGALIDLLGRAAAMSLRIGKLNVAYAAGYRPHAMEVDARQTLVEFRSAFDLIKDHPGLDSGLHEQLALAQAQWLFFSQAVGSTGLAPDARSLRDLSTTSDRIAETLLLVSERLLARLPAPTAPAAPAALAAGKPTSSVSRTSR